MASVVVYDAKVLYDNTLRDMMIRVARSRLVQEEVVRSHPARSTQEPD